MAGDPWAGRVSGAAAAAPAIGGDVGDLSVLQWARNSSTRAVLLPNADHRALPCPHYATVRAASSASVNHRPALPLNHPTHFSSNGASLPAASSGGRVGGAV